jgi:AcrR family transcriptional regulator
VPRPKTLADAEVLQAAHVLVHEQGPEALTFALLARACGLSASTLVQRFKSKQELVRSTLLWAWDRLDERTGELAATAPRSPQGAIELLVGLSRAYGDIEAYANGLLVLREDLRDPALQARGAAWKVALCDALEVRFAGRPPGIGLLMASHWQGSLLWWSFEPQGAVEDHVARSLEHFVAAVLR